MKPKPPQPARVLSEDAQFLAWAKRALAGVDQSGVMLGILSARQSNSRLEFALQIGHCLLEDKPLILIAPQGADVPAKLRAAATVLEWFVPGNEASVMEATKRALATVGLPVKH